MWCAPRWLNSFATFFQDRAVAARGLSVIVRAGGALLTGSVQCVADFLIEDACGICGRESDAGTVATMPREAQPFTDPVTVRLVGSLSIRNRPFCRACLGELEPARRTGTLGYRDGCGVVYTQSDAQFEPEGIPPRGGLSTSGGSAGGNPESDAIAVVAPFMTNDPVLKIVHLAKFAGYRELIRPMAGAIGTRVPRVATSRVTVMVPVPLWTGGNRRPVDHATELARALSAVAGIPVLENSLIKTRETVRQSVTALDRRAANVRGAFRFAGGSLMGTDVWLVDDLVTTGATAGACAAVLFGAGAENVGVLCFARSL